MVQLARLSPDSYVQAKDLASQDELPGKFLEAILLTLRRGGLLESKVGAGGGYRLAKLPRNISVGDVIQRLEERLAPAPLPSGLKGEAQVGAIAVRVVNQRLTTATEDALSDLTLEHLLEEATKASNSSQSMYYI